MNLDLGRIFEVYHFMAIDYLLLPMRYIKMYLIAIADIFIESCPTRLKEEIAPK